jgi:hypothetical protein
VRLPGGDPVMVPAVPQDEAIVAERRRRRRRWRRQIEAVGADDASESSLSRNDEGLAGNEVGSTEILSGTRTAEGGMLRWGLTWNVGVFSRSGRIRNGRVA